MGKTEILTKDEENPSINKIQQITKLLEQLDRIKSLYKPKITAIEDEAE